MEGLLAPIACKVPVEILYGARLARFALLRPTAALASKITKWDTVCDRMLHRLVCYINSSLDFELKGHIGDSSKYFDMTLFSDADFCWMLRYCEVYIRCIYRPYWTQLVLPIECN